MQTALVAILAGIAAIGVIVLWLGLFLRPEVEVKPEYIQDKQETSIFQDLRRRYEELDLPMPYGNFVAVCAAISAIAILFGIVTSLFLVGLIVAVVSPLVVISYLRNKRDDIRHQRREELVDVIMVYEDLLGVHNDIQTVNLLMANRPGYFAKLFQKINEMSLGEMRLTDALEAGAKLYDSQHWRDFIFLLQNAERFGARIKSALAMQARSLSTYNKQVAKMRAAMSGNIQASYIALLIYFLIVVFLRLTPDFGQYLTQGFGLLAQILSAGLAIFSWYLFQVFARRGLYIDDSNRVLFKSTAEATR